MSDSPEKSWSNLSQIPHSTYFEEKSTFAGVLIGGIFYGTEIDVFICECSLFNLSLKGLPSLWPSNAWARFSRSEASGEG